MIKTKDTYASKLYIFLFFLKNFTFRIFFKNFDFFFNFFETFFNFKFFVTSVEKGWGYVPIWEMGGVYPYMGAPQCHRFLGCIKLITPYYWSTSYLWCQIIFLSLVSY
jgi:hypothetical protein